MLHSNLNPPITWGVFLFKKILLFSCEIQKCSVSLHKKSKNKNIMEEELKSVFHYFRKDFSELYPPEGADKNLIRPVDVYSKTTVELNKRLGIHKINKQNKRR